MKRIITKLLAAAMLLTVLALPLTSCSEAGKLNRMEEPERAVSFFELLEKKADEYESVTLEQKMSFKLDIGDVAYEQVNEGTVTYVEEDGKLYYLEKSDTTVWVGGEKTVTHLEEGFMEDTMFSYYKEGSVETKLKSPISREEYETFRKNKAEEVPDIAVGEDYCTAMTCVQKEDGTWVATYEDFTEKGLKPFLHIIKGVETALNAEHTFSDVRLTYIADEKLNPVSMTMEFLFDEKEGAETRVPAIKVETHYKDPGSTSFSEPYDLSDFSEQEDIRMIENFTSALSDRRDAEAGAFQTTTSAKAEYMGQSNKTTSTQNVTFENRDGFEFNLSYTQEGYDVNISYKNGSMATVVRETKTGTKVDSSSETLSDFEAQTMVQQLMNSEQISALDIIGAEVRDEEKGLYRFILGDAVKNELNEQYEASYGTGIDKFSGHIDATVVEGKLMSYTYHVYTSLKLEGQAMVITVDYSVTFSEHETGSEAV